MFKYLLGLLCILLITASNAQQQSFIAKKGVMDLRQWNFHTQQNIPITGEYTCYWQQLYTFNDFPVTTPPIYYTTPNNWNTLPIGDSLAGGFGYATMRLQVLLPSNILDERLSLRIRTTATATQIYCNRALLSEIGVVGKDKASTTPQYKPQIVDIPLLTDTLELMIHQANFHHRRGGLWESLEIGLEDSLRNSRQKLLLSEIFLAGCMLIMAIYHFGFYYLRRKDKSPLYFGLACTFLCFRTLATGEYQLGNFFPISWSVLVKTEYISMMMAGGYLMLFFDHLFKGTSIKLLTKIIIWGASLMAFFVLCTPPILFTYTTYPFYVIILLATVNLSQILVRSIRKKRNGALPFLIGSTVFIFTIFHDLLLNEGIIASINLAPFGTFSFILSQAYLLSSRLSKSFTQSERLGLELSVLNQTLEERIEKRTIQLQDSNQDLLKLNQEISIQAKSLQQANKKLTSSITYAKRIQQALLIDWAIIRRHFPNSFVYLKPKDLVSGDFYWYTYREDKAIFAMLDCTGHGVPGAFMSLIGNEILNGITQRIPPQQWNCANILTKMDQRIRKALKQDQTKRSDGMDMGICIVDKATGTLQYAGAKVPLIYFQNSKLHFLKGSSRPIGGRKRTKELPFENHTISLHTPTHFYLYSDGFQDQFGGEEGMKFMAKNFRSLLFNIHLESPQKQLQLIDEHLHAWKGQSPQIDDILIMGIHTQG